MLIEPIGVGLYCSAGAFHIDPWLPVDRSVITHTEVRVATHPAGHIPTLDALEQLIR